VRRPRGYQLIAWVAAAAAGSAVIAAFQTPLWAAPSQVSQPAAADPGAAAYAKNCAMCHGDHRQGSPPAIPALTGIGHKMTRAEIVHLVHNGRGRMPAFAALPDQEVESIAAFLTGNDTPSKPVTAQPAVHQAANSPAVQAGDALFHQNCAFCHGRDAMGGESGPDLTESKLVRSDNDGDKIAPVVREGRPGTKMPGFNFSAQEMQSIVAFLHARVAAASTQQGKRRGVAPSDLQTGNVAAGKAYFNGAGGCNRCHSPTGDLAGIATRYQGLQLEERMLYPRDAKSTVTVTLPSGEKVSGTLAYQDEFTIALIDGSGQYHSWSTGRVRYAVDSPVDAHVKLFPQYTDDDIHNLMAYLQTLH
jgi:mono/diheme cytochrome c family protein